MTGNLVQMRNKGILGSLSYYRVKNFKRRQCVAGNAPLNLSAVATPIDPTIVSSTSRVGWIAQALNYYGDKMQFERFAPISEEVESAVEIVNEFMKDTRFGEQIHDLHNDLLIDGTSFVVFTPGNSEDGEPKYVAHVMSGSNVSVRLNNSREVIEAVILRGNRGILWDNKSIREFSLNSNGQIEKIVEEYNNPLGFVPVVPFSLGGIFGKGQGIVTKSAMSIEAAANRAQVAREAALVYYAHQTRVWANINPSILPESQRIDSRPGADVTIPVPENYQAGDPVPIIQTINGASPTPILENLSVLSRMFAGETLIPEHDLTGNQANPTSAEALATAESRMNDRTARYIKDVSHGWERFNEVVLRLTGNMSREEAYDASRGIRADYAPLYRESPAARTDRIIKEVQVGLRQVNSEITAKEIFGADWELGLAENEQAQRGQLLRALVAMDAEEPADAVAIAVEEAVADVEGT